MLQDENEALIIEAGMKLIEAKKALSWNIAKVVGCIISHSHNDHAGYAKDYESAGFHLLALPEVIQAKHLTTAAKPITIGKRYRQGWKPDWKSSSDKYIIENFHNKLHKECYSNIARILSFQSEEVRYAFLENFRDLIEEAKELI